MSLLLGTSAILGLLASRFLLPLLQSSYDARRVLVQRQAERLAGLLDLLRHLRAGAMYGSADGGVSDGDENVSGKAKGADVQQTDGRLPPTTSPIAAERDGQRDADQTNPSSSLLPAHSDQDLPFGTAPYEPLPLAPLIQLSTSLRALSAALSATATTRTSLLSTLEGYTSQLHRDIYLRPTPGSLAGGGTGRWGSVGLGSLGANLAKESGRDPGSKGGLSGVGEEWDAVRKEVRAVKGLLLSRRGFSVTA